MSSWKMYWVIFRDQRYTNVKSITTFQVLYISSTELEITQLALLPHSYGRKCGSFHFVHVTGSLTNPCSPM